MLAVTSANTLNSENMRMQLFLLTLLFGDCSLYGQKAETILSKIKNVSEAKSFINNNPRMDAKLFSISRNSDTSEIHLPLYEKKSGFTFEIGNVNYKLLQVDSALSFRVSYIYLNSDQLSKNLIDSLRNVIISKYKAGESFLNLVQQYSMDGNITGDTGWFTENMMVRSFETAVRNHKKGDIFVVDTPDQNWYHVVLKVYDDTFIKKLTILKIKNSS